MSKKARVVLCFFVLPALRLALSLLEDEVKESKNKVDDAIFKTAKEITKGLEALCGASAIAD